MNTKDLDVVYFVKDGLNNDELRYSIRSVCQNMPHKRIWVFGGCPANIIPDVRVRVAQTGETKWDKVRNMFMLACENKEITDDFILFNDDFFVMNNTTKITPMYRCTLSEHIGLLDAKYSKRRSEYANLLRECEKKLRKLGKPTLSYELHVPFVFNKRRLMRLLKLMPTQHCTRTMYGNLYGIGGVKANDVKVFSIHPEFDYKNQQFLSTDDGIVNVNNDVWQYIQKQFPKRSEHEI